MARQRGSDLELDGDIGFHRRSWRMERVAWIVMAFLIAAALAGLFGTGPLSRRTVSAHGGELQVEYDRYARYTASTTLRIRAIPVGAQRQSRLGVDAAFLDSVRIEEITPRPDSVESASGQLIYVFTFADTAEPGRVTFHFKPQHIGRASGRVSIAGGPSVSFEQFVYP